MTQLMDNVEYLAKRIGPRPAGTEEEQQAALYITEQFQKESGFAATIEDFSSTSNMDAGFAVLAAVEVVATILAMIFPVLCIPAFILAAAAAVVYALEAFDRPILSRVLSRGASQNVIAKYQPGADSPAQTGRGRKRTLVLLVHYDTGRVTPPLVSRLESTGLPLAFACVIAMISAAFFLLLRIFVAGGGGMGLLALNVLSIVAILVCLLPIVKALLVRSAPYNEGACNNATGTAALLEVARRVSRGSVSEAELAVEFGDNVVVHGEAAAREAGLVPEGAQIRYDAGQLEPPAEIGSYSDEDRLLSAKAAIAAMTGRPVEPRVFGSVAENLVNSPIDRTAEDGVKATGDAAYAAGLNGSEASVSVTGAPAHDFSSVPGVSAPASEPARVEKAEGFENAPSWFVAAQQNARKTERYNADEATPVKRSRYTEAIESAERGFNDREEEIRAAERERREEEARAAIASRAASVDEPEPAAGGAADGSAGQPSQGESVPRAEASAAPSPLQSPHGTIAMSAPVSSAEIRAEAAADDAASGFSAGLDAESDAGVDGELPDGAGLEAVRSLLAQTSSPGEAGDAGSAQHDRIPSLPSIDPAQPYNPSPASNPSRSGILRKLRTNIPSLSGLIAPVGADQQANAGTSEPAGAAAVEVPRSRSGNLISRLRKNDEEEELVGTPQEWLNVDDDFEARSVGRARGSWESFRDEQNGEGGLEGAPSDRRWEGGAFSRTQLGHVSMLSGESEEAPVDFAPANEDGEQSTSFTGEIEQIYHFRNPHFNTEIWFVAIGSDGVSHDGARAFLAEHASELRGSTIIEVESLGAGVLSVAHEEGRIRKITASSRVKRFLRSATAATGISVDNVSLVGSDSISSTLQKAGFQTVHLFGAEDGRPALKGSPDDVLENVNEQALEEHVNFIYELLKD